MRQFDKICIVGVGLIGGSIGLAIKKRGLAGVVIGVFRHKKTLKKALKARAIDRGLFSIEEGVRDADLIIAATPVSSIPRLVGKAMGCAKPGAIITDVGSAKRWIVEEVEKQASSKTFFVGSHPMAGSEHAGVEYAKADLLEKAPCIVTRTRRTNPAVLKKVVNFWYSLGANVKVMSPAQHDRIVSLVSHIPHVVAFSLAGAVPSDALAYAAEGFRDTTRVASSDPEMWADIFISNKDEVIRAGRLFTNYYNRIAKALSRGDYNTLVRMLKRAKPKRDRYIHGKRA